MIASDRAPAVRAPDGITAHRRAGVALRLRAEDPDLRVAHVRMMAPEVKPGVPHPLWEVEVGEASLRTELKE